MIRNMGLLEKWENEKKEDEEKVNKCPICKLNGGGGALCPEHARLLSDFKWLRNYLNNLDEVNKDTIYIMDYAISNRVSFIINDVEIVHGRLRIEEYLERENCSEFMERILKEILLLRKAKGSLLNLMEEA